MADLLTVVRIHEYAHSIVHLGISEDDVESELSKFANSGPTD